MKNIYLALAIVGAIVPYALFLPFFQANGLSLPDFVGALFVNGAAGGFTVDLLISSAVFWLFMGNQRRIGAGPDPVVFILLNLLIGLSCALPAYLYARERRAAA